MHARLAVARRELPRAVRIAVAAALAWWIARLLGAGLAIGLFLRTGPELNTQIAISAILVVIVTRNADQYAVERIWETGLGSVVTLAVAAFVLPPDPLADCQRRLAASASALAADLAAARGTLTTGDWQEVASARELMAAFQREDSRPVSAILRRPLVLLLDELSGPAR